MLDTRDLILKRMRWIVDNGIQIKFWTFNWVFDCRLLNFLPHDRHVRTNIDESVEDYVCNGTWNRDKLNRVLDA